jgi:RNA polymerase-binding transcription factor DksA
MGKVKTKKAPRKKTKGTKSLGTRKSRVRVSAKKVQKSIVARERKTYSQKDLEHFRQVILEQKKEMVEELQSLSERMMDTMTGEYPSENSTYSLHMAEQGTDASEREKAFLLAQRGDDHVRRLDESLERIKDGSYGCCVVCGDLIERGRLEAVPTTQKHVNCKNRIKRLHQEP